MKKIISIVGARPQFIKAAMISRALRKNKMYKEMLLHTGQHYDDNMSDIFFRDLNIPRPDFLLQIRSKRQGEQTALMLDKIEKILIKEQPKWLLVYGDTNSTLAGALAAAKLNIPIAHIESGLRSFNNEMPEEVNRKITDHLSTVLFCPTQIAMENAMKEGISTDKLFLVGDVTYDAALYAQKYDEKNNILVKLNLKKKSYILVTIHRIENTDDTRRLKKLMLSLKKIANNYKVLFPIHPRTRLAIEKSSCLSSMASVFKLIEPVGYLEMSALERGARLIITDSGGVQKEAYFYQIPCIIVRDQTEWPELLNTGNSILCPSKDFATLPSLGDEFIDKCGNYLELYGSGNAATKIVKYLYNFS
ncbi:MAG: UDP-N-acetylglucosamine 2-epimerase (non-hydrolyzing) [Rickettsiella sp.]|nr:UDP-N-acetylglucosamine 2-epimerase (non-hydrolyzing) [Rickettsiella sp.]